MNNLNNGIPLELALTRQQVAAPWRSIHGMMTVVLWVLDIETLFRASVARIRYRIRQLCSMALSWQYIRCLLCLISPLFSFLLDKLRSGSLVSWPAHKMDICYLDAEDLRSMNW